MSGSTRGPFIGREEDLDALGEVFAAGRLLVTIVGSPGVGKTRLATEFAGRSRRTTRICDLTGASERAEILVSLGESLEVNMPSGGTLKALSNAVAKALSDPELLVVIDNAEHIVGELRDLLEQWHEHRAKILVTSRRRLELASETVFALKPLVLRGQDGSGNDSLALLKALAESAGAPLNSDAASSEETFALLWALDGLPLAIELAARRLTSLTIRELAGQLERGIDLLRGPSREVRNRHHSLRSAIELSWSLLKEGEQRLLACLSLFGGPFTLEAAGAFQSKSAAIDIVHKLVDQSLLQAIKPASSDTPMRYRILESVKDVGRDRLKQSDYELEAKEQYSGWVIDCAEALAERQFSAGHAAATDELAKLRPDLMGLIRSGTADASPRQRESAIRAASAMFPSVVRFGPVEAHRELLLDVLEPASNLVDIPAKIIAHGFLTIGRSLTLSARYDDAEDTYRRALQYAEDSKDPATIAIVQVRLAWCESVTGSLDDAYERALAGRRMFDGCGDRKREAWAESVIAIVQQRAGRVSEAMERFEDAIVMARRAQSPLIEVVSLTNLGCCQIEVGEPALAVRTLEKVLVLFEQEHQIPAYVPITKLSLAHAHYALGNLERSEELFGEGQQAARDRDQASICAETVLGIAMVRLDVALASDDALLASARDGFVEAGRAAAELNEWQSVVIASAYRGVTEAALGETRAARTALERAKKDMSEHGQPLTTAAVGILEHASAVLEAQAKGDGDSDDELATVNAARKALADAESELSAERLRVARAFLQRCTEATTPAQSTLLISRDFSEFRAGHGPVVSLAKRAVLGRVLGALVSRRVRSPGQAFSAELLFAAAWDDEKAITKAKLNRVRVAIAELRKLGLADIILSDDIGYWLDSQHSVRRLRRTAIAAAANNSA